MLKLDKSMKLLIIVNYLQKQNTSYVYPLFNEEHKISTKSDLLKIPPGEVVSTIHSRSTVWDGFLPTQFSTFSKILNIFIHSLYP